MMSSEHDYMKGSRQHTWLENDLKNVDRSVTPWVIIGGHRPMYTSQAILSKCGGKGWGLVGQLLPR